MLRVVTPGPGTYARRRRRQRRRRAVAAGVLVLALLLLAGLLVRRLDEGRHTQGARIEHFEIKSRYVHRTMRETAVIPVHAGGQHRPLLVFLHGRDSDEDGNLDDEMFAALRRQGRRAPVIAFPRGGDRSYWHDRRSGRWGAYVMREVIPETEKRFGTDRRRLALGGISMGGFGAYDLAIRRKRPLCAVGGHSPAISRSAGDKAPGAFDDRADFRRHDVIRLARSEPRRFARQPLWLDAGTADPFDAGDRAFVAALRSAHVPIRVHRWPGGHDRSYWRARWAAYLAFYTRALARCRGTQPARGR